jgi:predicted membrane channel-forming protein YqfA (hemolysin III family)
VITLAELPVGYAVCNPYVTRGYRASTSLTSAALSMFEANHNEFWNIWSDIAPLIYFAHHSRVILGRQRFDQLGAQDLAFVGAILATVLQHLLSTIAHTFACMSADVSTSIWCLDYAGIGANFGWITTALLLIAVPELTVEWPSIRCCTAVHSVAVLGLGVALARRLTAKSGGPESNAAGRLLLFFSFPFVLVPHYYLLLQIARAGDSKALCIAALLPVGLVVKSLKLPDRWAPKGGVGARLGYTPFSSHCIWHLLVWAIQRYYFFICIDHVPVLQFLRHREERGT